MAASQSPATIAVRTIESASWSQNGFAVWRLDPALNGDPSAPDAPASDPHSAILFDPGYDWDAILDELRERNLRVAAILLTHGHHDHIGGVDAIKKEFPDAPIVVGRNEAHLLTDAVANLSRRWGIDVTCAPADRLVDEGEIIEYAGLRFEVREIPGHSPGSVVYILQDHDPMLIFGGDVLFQGSVGRFDFPGGDGKRLFDGIRAKLFTLPDSAVVLPGHGPLTTIGQEKRSNPYLS